ncbi:MAG: hypothetical protein MR321_13555 [Bacteroides sp.]|nr:hypothetical protein [Bacteroides sp.]
MKLNYNEWLKLAFWEYNRYPDEELTRELFQETFGSVPGAHYYEKWVHYYEKNLLGMIAYFRGKEDKGQKFCDMVARQVERYVQNREAYTENNHL